MIHIFELTPKPNTLNKWVSRLPGCQGTMINCDPGPVPNTNFCYYEFRGTWSLGIVNKMIGEALIDKSVNLMSLVMKSIMLRIRDDHDDDPTVYCVLSSTDRSLIAAIIEARNAFLECMASVYGYTNEEVEQARKYLKLWMPVAKRVSDDLRVLGFSYRLIRWVAI